MKTEIMILNDSPEAAQLKTITGWVSRDGIFFGDDERTARYSGCTHVRCSDCGEPVEKGHFCRPCHGKRSVAKWEALKREKWDGEAPVYSEACDKYFFGGKDEVLDFCDGAEIEPDTLRLRLVLCRPMKAPQFDASDLLCDYLPEDGDVPEEIEQAVEALNAAIEKGEPLAWEPSNVAVEFEWSAIERPA